MISQTDNENNTDYLIDEFMDYIENLEQKEVDIIQ